MQEEKKPLGVFILGGFNCFIRGLLSFLAAAYIYFNSSLKIEDILQDAKQYLPRNLNLSPQQLKTAVGLEMTISLVFLISGAGLLMRKEWARKLTLYFSFFIVVLALVSVIVNPGLIGQIFIQIIYPGILILYFTNKRVENYFSPQPQEPPKEQ